MQGKQSLFIFALKRNKKYGSKTKPKEKSGKRSEKKNTEAKNEAK
jgi:hypothetical protein